MEYVEKGGVRYAVDEDGALVPPWSALQPTDAPPPWYTPDPVPVDLGEIPALADAVAAVADLEGRLAQWEAEGAAAEAELQDLGSRAGDEVLNDPAAAAGLTDAMTRLRDRAQMAQRAAQAAARRLEPARRRLLAARAVSLRQRAAQLTAAADVRQRKTDRILEQLAKHEGAPFVPTPQPGWGMVGPGAIRGGGESYAVPLTQVIRRLASGLTVEASQLDQYAIDAKTDVAHFASQPEAEVSELEGALQPDGSLVGFTPDQFTGMLAVG